MENEKNSAHCAWHIGCEILKIGLKVAAVTAAFLTAKELHKVHKAIEHHHDHHHHLLSK